VSNTSSRLTNVLLGGALVLLAVDRTAPAVHAQQAGGSSYFAVTAPGQGQGTNVLFVIDPTTERLMVYEHKSGGKLELVTVRTMELDRAWLQWPAAPHPRAPIPAVSDMKPPKEPKEPPK
jgi:hypothetical protein